MKLDHPIALTSSEAQLDLYEEIVLRNSTGWLGEDTGSSDGERAASRERALAMGAVR